MWVCGSDPGPPRELREVAHYVALRARRENPEGGGQNQIKTFTVLTIDKIQ